MTVRRLPWVSFGIMALCTALLVVVGNFEALEVFSRWGLVPDDPAAETLISHIFLHAGWAHLLGNLFLLFLAGPPIEDRWGRPLFIGFFLSAGAFSGAFHMALTPGSPLPLVGASGAISAALGACMVRHWKSKIRFMYLFFIPPRMIRGTFWAPTWLMLPLWFASELLSGALTHNGGMTGGVAYWAHVGGFVYGAMFAASIRQWKIEERFIHPVIESKVTVMTNPAVEAAMEARMSGDSESAYRILTEAVAADPSDPETATAYWELACERKCPEHAAHAMLRIADDAMRRGDRELAVRYWCETMERAPGVRADPLWLTRLVPVLLQMEMRSPAVTALRHALDTPQGASAGTATRVLELARDLDAHTAVMAARMLLDAPDLHEDRRAKVEALLVELEQRAADMPSRVASERRELDFGDARAIELPPDPVTPSPNHAAGVDPGVTPPLELDATGSLVASVPDDAEDDDGYIGLSPDAVMPNGFERFAAVKPIESVPLELGENALQLERPGGRRGNLEYARIQAIAVAAVKGLSKKPVLVVDLALNWRDLEQDTLRTVRLRSDGFDVQRLMPGHPGALAAFRALVAELLTRSRATPLPDSASAEGNPFRSFDDLAQYEHGVLEVSN